MTDDASPLVVEYGPRHYVDVEGRFLGTFYGLAEPPAGAIQVAEPPPPSYRVLRAAAYSEELGSGENDRVSTIGDVLDTLIREMRGRGPAATPEFARLVEKIDAIKARFPK
jgi:hypothetical protein